MSELNRTAVVWFRNDLRIHDHEPLISALQSRPANLVCVYVLDPRHFGTTRLFHFPKTGPIRAKFLFESLADLRKKLQAMGNDLLILRGFPEIVVPELIEKMQPCELYYHQEATDEETQVEASLDKALTDQGVKAHSYWGSTLYHKSDLPFEVKNLPPVFTQFRLACENNAKIRPPLASPTTVPPAPSGVDFGRLPELKEFDLPEPSSDPRSVLQFEGGETAAMERLNHYFWETDRLKSYKLTRNGLLGADYSSKFAPWLAIGCISPRQIAAEVALYEHDRVHNDSTYWLVFELIWRDYFRFFALQAGTSLFHLSGPRKIKKNWNQDNTLLNAWIEGRTGIPFIDANMRELLLTGFQSNRGRQNVASFLVKSLGVDWRAGAEWFESQLIDFDVCSNWGNWSYVAGVGNDPRQDRYFQVIKQARDYDPKGIYVKTWLPELESLSAEMVHEPWRMEQGGQGNLSFGFQYGRDYPRPIVDLEASYTKLRAEQASNPNDQSRPFHQRKSRR